MHDLEELPLRPGDGILGRLLGRRLALLLRLRLGALERAQREPGECAAGLWRRAAAQTQDALGLLLQADLLVACLQDLLSSRLALKHLQYMTYRNELLLGTISYSYCTDSTV